jgi:hypothetical protein
MKRTWIIAIPLLVVLVLLVGMGAVACGGNGEEEAPPGEEEDITPPSEEEEEEAPPTPALPQPGEWTISSAGSSQFSLSGFTVNPDSTGITKVYYHFKECECMGVQLSGDVESSRDPVWPITGSQFTVDLDVRIQYGPDWDLVIEGSFDETGTHASGTWEVSVEGTTCQAGTWEAWR